MYRVSRERVHQVLHDYKKECFFLEHRSGTHEQVEQETRKIVKELLAIPHHFQFHTQPTPERAEILNLIEDYVREAVLPPILNRLVERLLVIERRHQAGVRALERFSNLFEESAQSSAER
jgi:hypothetical protein